MALVVPVVNYWWPSLPAKLSNKVFNKLPLLERWRLRFIHYAPKFAWLLQQRLQLPTIDLILKENPKIFNKSDLAIVKLLSELPSSDKVPNIFFYSLNKSFTHFNIIILLLISLIICNKKLDINNQLH